MSHRFVRLADSVAVPLRPTDRGAGDLADFVGTWASSDANCRGVPRLGLRRSGAGRLAGRIHAAGDGGEEIAWGEVEAEALYTDGVSSDTVAGFVLDYGHQELHTRVQANLKLGVAVLGVFLTLHSPRRPLRLFWREFMGRVDRRSPENGAGTPAPVAPALVRGGGDSGGVVEGSMLTGRWRNTLRASRGVAELTVEPQGDGVALRLWGVGEGGTVDWGESNGPLFACIEEDAVESACALVRYDLGFMQAELQVRQNKGILAVTFFNRFTDGSGRRDYVARELFHRV